MAETKTGFLEKANEFLRPVIQIMRAPSLDLVGEIYWRYFNLKEMRRVQEWKVNFILYFAKTDLDQANHGEFFDAQRADLVREINHQFKYDVGVMQVDPEKLIAITVQTYAKLSRGLLVQATETKDANLAQSYKGIAWSVLVNDASQIFSKNTDYIINPEWKNSLWRLMGVKNPDFLKINTEIDNFTAKDLTVFKFNPAKVEL